MLLMFRKTIVILKYKKAEAFRTMSVFSANNNLCEIISVIHFFIFLFLDLVLKKKKQQTRSLTVVEL